MRKRTKILKKLKYVDKHSPQKAKLENKVEDIETKIKESHKKQQEHEEQQAVSSIKRNPKYFYTYAKRKLKTRVQIGPLKDGGKLVENEKEMAEILKKQYDSVFSVPAADKLIQSPTDFFTSDQLPLQDFDFNENDVSSAIDEISPNSSPGPDDIPAILLKKCKESLSKPIYKLWRKSLDLGKIPQVLKEGIITPIFKGGSRGLPKNYRPVTLTSHIIKIFERILRKQVVRYLEEEQMFNPGQHGFRKGRSCLSQLLEHFGNVLEDTKNGDNVDVIYLDFAKAFDKVDHNILLRKIKALGIGGKIGIWIHHFLAQRMQTVTVSGSKSGKSMVISGVPQGSVLGPLLFLIMIADISEDVQSSRITSFADDTRISKKITSAQDVVLLQEDLDAVYNWAHNNNMHFNNDKFELIRYGQRAFADDGYNVNLHNITEKDAVRDLGILMNSDCTFTDHIENISNSARQMSGWILRTFKSRDPNHLLPLWKSLVMSKLEYLCQLWSPEKTGDIQKLEQIQRTFTRKLRPFQQHKLNYWERLKELKLYSLQRRRERYCIIYTWKILENKVPNPLPEEKGGIKSQRLPRLGRTCYRRVLDSSSQRHKTLLSTSFLNVGPRLFNSLPKDIREMTGCTIEAFKRSLDKFLQRLPDEPPIPHGPAPRGARSNSIPDQLQYIRMEERCGGGGPPGRPW